MTFWRLSLQSTNLLRRISDDPWTSQSNSGLILTHSNPAVTTRAPKIGDKPKRTSGNLEGLPESLSVDGLFREGCGSKMKDVNPQGRMSHANPTATASGKMFDGV